MTNPDTRERSAKFTELSDVFKECVPWLTVMCECYCYGGDPIDVVFSKATALSRSMKQCYWAMVRLMRRVVELERDMSYRDRALRAERYVREMRREITQLRNAAKQKTGD